MTTLGAYIKERRNQLNRMTQKQLAERLAKYGVYRDHTAIAAWEADTNPVHMDVIPALALALEEKSPNKLYDLLGVVENLSGADIVRLLSDAEPSDIAYLTEMVKSHFKNKPK